MCFKFKCNNHGNDILEYYAIKEGYTHRPIPFENKQTRIEETKLIKDGDKYLLTCKCPTCGKENTIELDDGQKNAYIVYTTEICNCQNEEDSLTVQKTLNEIRECCYSIITVETMERLKNNLEKFKKIKNMQVVNKNIKFSITDKEFVNIIESLMEEMK